jgi:hypothetical protein
MNEQTLKLQLAKMLPEKLYLHNLSGVCWQSNTKPECIFDSRQVLDTEWLHVCWLVEEELKKDAGKWTWFVDLLRKQPYYGGSIHATWQQRAIALCKVKGIEV